MSLDDDDEDLPPDVVRSAQEVARRALALFAVWGITTEAPRDDVLAWLDDAKLRDALSPLEAAFVANEHPDRRAIINFSWHSERLFVLLWALKFLETLPEADEQCDTAIFKQHLPPFSAQSAEQFIANATLRDEYELSDEQDRSEHLHWQARDAKIHNRAPKDRVDIEIIQERHYAINWVMGYQGLDWDDVTTDT